MGNLVSARSYIDSPWLTFAKGELEITMFESFCAGQEIRALLISETLPEPITKWMLPEFERVFEQDGGGTLLNDMFACRDEVQLDLQNTTHYTRLERSLEVRLQKLLREAGLIDSRGYTVLGEDVLLQRSIMRRGVRFCPKSASVGDSQVVFGDLSTGAWNAGNISEIIVWPRHLRTGQIEYHSFAVVEALRPLSEEHIKFDNYRTYLFTAGRLYYTKSDTVVVSFQDIVCHYACIPRPSQHTAIPQDCVHVLPLDRVRKTNRSFTERH